MKTVDPAYIEFLERLQEVITQSARFEKLEVENIRSICGIDVAYRGDRAVATAVLYNAPSNTIIEVAKYDGRTYFPYVPSLLFMREAPLMLAASRRLVREPDLILVDGHGTAHPRGAGLAVVVGVLSNKPTVGVAKSLLTGDVGVFDGAFAPIDMDGSRVGFAVKPDKSKVYYVSPGHRVRMEDMAEIFRSLGIEYPAVLKEAHKASREGVKAVE